MDTCHHIVEGGKMYIYAATTKKQFNAIMQIVECYCTHTSQFYFLQLLHTPFTLATIIRKRLIIAEVLDIFT